MTVILLALMHAPSLPAADLPNEFTAHYKFTRGLIPMGKIRRTFRRTGENEFMFESISKPAGFGRMFSDGEIHERSNWTIVDNILRPLTYSYKNSDSDIKRNVKLNFDWNKQVVVNNINGDPWQMKLEPETQDKLLYLLSLMIDLARGKEHLEYKVADGGTTKTYLAVIMGEEKVTTDLGTFATLKIMREHHDHRKTLLWCAPSLQYLPVQMEHVKTDGSSVSATLYNLEGIPIQGKLAK